MIPGAVVAVMLWVLAGLLLTEYEVNVRVLRPWQRDVYGVAAFLAGLALAALVMRGGR